MFGWVFGRAVCMTRSDATIIDRTFEWAFAAQQKDLYLERSCGSEPKWAHVSSSHCYWFSSNRSLESYIIDKNRTAIHLEMYWLWVSLSASLSLSFVFYICTDGVCIEWIECSDHWNHWNCKNKVSQQNNGKPFVRVMLWSDTVMDTLRWPALSGQTNKSKPCIFSLNNCSDEFPFIIDNKSIITNIWETLVHRDMRALQSYCL